MITNQVEIHTTKASSGSVLMRENREFDTSEWDDSKRLYSLDELLSEVEVGDVEIHVSAEESSRTDVTAPVAE